MKFKSEQGRDKLRGGYYTPGPIAQYDLYEFSYLKAKYETPYKQFDKYFAFVEFAITHTACRGIIGVVIPNKWMTVASGSLLRKFIRKHTNPVWLHNFKHHSVFEEKQIYVCAPILSKDKHTAVYYSEPSSIEEFSVGTYEVFTT